MLSEACHEWRATRNVGPASVPVVPQPPAAAGATAQVAPYLRNDALRPCCYPNILYRRKGQVVEQYV